ncbi:potassium uptake protein KtrA [Spiroplasma sp. TIUS-1]|uniref:potassium channel family protein n=1 Tax=Spiroplasma sp. TIUS-1 TaxID=216963 RepID=UPI001398F168|nr:TrkA family potassium uptake protein [Spiroplasma sp. TIUS-1]QHX36122.1 potassium uptake protein KtrA [Spiroplasma sp. TIUS-1]
MAKKKKTFAIIGANNLGISIARELDKKKQLVNLFDINEDKLNLYMDEFEFVEGIIADCTIKRTLEKNGVGQFDSVIVCMGSNINSSLTVTLNLIDLGIDNFLVQTNDDKHKRMLLALGLKETQIIIPNEISGKLIATKSLFDIDVDVQSIDDEYIFVKLDLLEETNFDKTIQDNNLAANKEFTIVQIRRDGKIIIPDEYTMLKEKDLLYIFAKNTIINDLVLKICGVA